MKKQNTNGRRSQRWPLDESFQKRFFVPDLSPQQRSQLKGLKAKIVFVAESPHEAETASEDIQGRRPLCGRAGQSWWKMIGRLLSGDPNAEFGVDLDTQLALCRQGQFVVMNAVQYPLDPKIVLYYGEIANPLEGLGFTKVAPASYKKLKSTDSVEAAVWALRERLLHASIAGLPVVSLGQDARWFVDMALGKEGARRHLETIPHPSAWWRQGGKLRERAREQLTQIFSEMAAGRIGKASKSQDRQNEGLARDI